jgi:PhzF family phenazine biosynthesis protein
MKIIQVDAFTDRPFAGNPAAVCLLDRPREDRWMQDVAGEMNLSETAFPLREGDGFRLRWFTPVVEVDLCGHATLATSHVLWEEGILEPDETARYQTKSGLLRASRRGDWIELDFPSACPEPADPPPRLLEALGVTAVRTGRIGSEYLVEVESEAVVREASPDFQLLRKSGAWGVILTSGSASPEFDFVSRFFAPGAGIDEDPVTGAAHCALGPYWKGQLGKDAFMAYQASARGGVVRVTVSGDRVKLQGQAVTVLRGELAIE